MQTMTKGEFAQECNVTPGRVSQWLSEGKIGPDCLKGEGRSARIIVDRAKAQIGLRRDVGQSLGNGLKTQLFTPDVPADRPSAPPAASPPRDNVAHQIQLEKLEGEKRKNRREAVDEEERLGNLVPADDVKAAMGRVARQVDDENGAMLADFATAIASRFEVPQRDVLHLLRSVRNEKKKAVAERLKATAQSIPETVEIVIEEGAGA
jgi:hypothetical protein